MKKNILFFSCEPGGAEVLIPVIRLLQKDLNFSVSVTGYGLGLNRFRAQNIDSKEIAPVKDGDSTVFDAFNPALIITSAASLPQKDMSEKFLWKNAKTKKIKTLAFLDQWQNYAPRFSGPSPTERLAYVPDLINCINEAGRREMLAEGFNNDLLVPLGHPYLSELKETAAALDRNAICQKWGIPVERPTALFVSEPIKDNFGDARGYTEYSALDFFISTVWPTERSSFIILKLHDKDALNKYAPTIESLQPNALVLGLEATPIEALVAADTVYGMTSLMLIQSFILGKKTVSLQPGLNVNDPLVLSREGYIRLLRSKKDIGAPWTAAKAAAFEFAFQKERFMKVLSSLI